ncbi:MULTISPECIES: hypothetical protein [Acinetobacter]|uniref:Uncharacterized protein n=1 Tax=Acinetobacter nematophilus TaxID=2994642 RepID=A0A9X3DWF3_9GAMM|nr:MULTISPECIES: hypothetical protein [Acinetobacter]MCX5469205.1 hypothetical protein [Acinetobacter nematophilus]
MMKHVVIKQSQMQIGLHGNAFAQGSSPDRDDSRKSDQKLL